MIKCHQIHELYRLVTGVKACTTSGAIAHLIKSGHIERSWNYDHWDEVFTKEGVDTLFPKKHERRLNDK